MRLRVAARALGSAVERVKLLAAAAVLCSALLGSGCFATATSACVLPKLFAKAQGRAAGHDPSVTGADRSDAAPGSNVTSTQQSGAAVAPTVGVAASAAVNTATAFLLSGRIASGKSTFARQLVALHNATYFSEDEWALRIHGPDFPAEKMGQVAFGIKREIWRQAEPLLLSGRSVVLDFSFWLKEVRDRWSRNVRRLGASAKIYFTTCSVETCRERLRKRNAQKLASANSTATDPDAAATAAAMSSTFFVAEAIFDATARLYETPDPSENAEPIPCEGETHVAKEL